MKSRYMITLAALCGVWSLGAQAGSRDTGWEFGGDLIYQNSQDIDFEGGSKAELDSDLGLALTFGYRFNEKLEFNFGLDWNNVDYKAHLISADQNPIIASIDVDGSMETFTPHVGVNFNFMDGPVTPYVTAMIGYSFIDTNIPDGPTQGTCWWDPWYGQICGTWQPTKSVDAFTYAAGLGVRWDVNDTWTARLGYEKHWVDISQATSTPDLDQFKLGFSIRY
jgi:opacity protein-like surface antigen